MHWICLQDQGLTLPIIGHLETDAVRECNSSTVGAVMPEVTLLCGYAGENSVGSSKEQNN